jgi:hypothetical protein
VISRIARRWSRCVLLVNGAPDLFVHDRAAAVTGRVSDDSPGSETKGPSFAGSISADGQLVAFASAAANLVAGDTNAVSDAFRFERCSAPASWFNHGPGLPGTHGVPAFTSLQPPRLDPALGR